MDLALTICNVYCPYSLFLSETQASESLYGTNYSSYRLASSPAFLSYAVQVILYLLTNEGTDHFVEVIAGLFDIFYSRTKNHQSKKHTTEFLDWI